MVDTCDKLKELIKIYHETYWSMIPRSLKQCTSVVETLLFTQRLHQERILVASNEHLERSIALHENRFGVHHSQYDIAYTLTSEDEDTWTHVNGPIELGSHWVVITDKSIKKVDFAETLINMKG